MDLKKIIETGDFEDYKTQRDIIKRYLRDANLLVNNNGSIATLCEVLEWVETFCDSLIKFEDKMLMDGYSMDEIAKALETIENDADKNADK